MKTQKVKAQAQKVKAQVKNMKKYEEKYKEKYDEKYFEEFKKCFNKVLEADEWRSKKEGDSYKPNEARDKIKEYHQDMFDIRYILKRKTWDRPYKFYRAMNEICGLVRGSTPSGTHIHGKCAMKCLIYMLNRHSTEQRVPVYPEIVYALGFGFTDVHPQTKQFIANRDDATDYYLFPCDEVSRVYKDFFFQQIWLSHSRHNRGCQKSIRPVAKWQTDMDRSQVSWVTRSVPFRIWKTRFF